MKSAQRLQLLALALALACLATAVSGETQLHWKPVDEAQLKLDGKPPRTWNVYQPDKKKESNLVLVLLGKRYLVLDMKAKLVYLVFPNELHASGKDFDSEELTKPARIVPSTDWVLRDIGPEESIRLTLEDYGRALEVELPHLIQWRGIQ